MTDNEKMLIHIPAGGEYIEILGHRIDGFDSFEAFCQHLGKFTEMEETINRQKAEIERLQDLIEEAQQYNEAWVADNGKLRKEAKNIRAEAVKEFAERLKEELKGHAKVYCLGHYYYLLGFPTIDNLVKEFTEEQE